MPTGVGTYQDLVIYEPEFFAGAWEALTQALNVFNAQSAGTIVLGTKETKGHFDKQSFFKNSSLVSRRDIDSTADATILKLDMDEWIAVKINRKIGPVDHNIDAFRKLGSDMRTVSFIIGRMAGEQIFQDMVNTGIASCYAALANVGATVVHDGSAGVIDTSKLVDGIAKFGDMGERIRAWVMHSKAYYDLVKGQIADKIVNVADRVIYGGTPATLNRPVIISDIPGLVVSGTPNTYKTLGLVPGAVRLEESEGQHIVSEFVTGKENLRFRIQGEYAYNLSLKGFKWDTTNGGINPADAALTTGTNWDKVMASVKDLAGVVVSTQ